MQVYGIAVNWAPTFAGVRGISWALRDTDLHRYDDVAVGMIILCDGLLNKTEIIPTKCLRALNWLWHQQEWSLRPW